MSPLAIAPLAAFVAVGCTVGVRMLLLARQTRQLPELLLGAGLSAVLFVTFPTTVLAVAVGTGSPPIDRALFAIGLLPVAFMPVCFAWFTQVVFRPGSRAARAAVAGIALISALDVAGLAWARLAHWGGPTGGATRPWMLVLLALICVGLLWTAWESLRYWREIRRRAALGLSDPVVANRFFLWGLGSGLCVLAMAGVAAAKVAGLVVVVHPLPVSTIAAAGLTISACWSLAFLPPQAYLRWLEARAG